MRTSAVPTALGYFSHFAPPLKRAATLIPGTYVLRWVLSSLRDSESNEVSFPGTYVPGYELASLRDSPENR